MRTLNSILLHLLLTLPTFVAVAAVSSAFIPRGGGVSATPLDDEPAPMAPDLGQDRATQSQLSTSVKENKQMDRIVQSQWEKHRRWARIAKSRKLTVEACRISKLVLVSTGAMLQVAATQLPAKFREPAVMAGGAFIGLANFIKKKFLTDDNIQSMVTSYTTSQAIKSEVFKFRAKVSPYDQLDANPDRVLSDFQKRCDGIHKSVFDPKLKTTEPDSVPLPGSLATADEYIERRLDRRIRHFNKKGKRVRQRYALCNRCEDVLMIFGTAASFTSQLPPVAQKIITMVGAEKIVAGLGGWSGAFTTVSAAFANHLAKNKFEEVSEDCSRAEELLKDLRETWPSTAKAAGSVDWDAQVTKSESIIESATKEWANIKKATLDAPLPEEPAPSNKGPVWDPKIVCGTDESGYYPALDRQNWLIENQNMTEEEAKQKVMDEFPENF